MQTAMILSMDTFSAIRNHAETLIKSGLLPSTVNSPEKAIAIITYGLELGIGAWTALTGINVIQGKPTVSPALMLGLINRSGQLEDMQIEADDSQATVTMKRKGRTPYTETFTFSDAQRMQLTGKDNYKKQPRVMLKWRAVSACARVVFPDVLNGLYTSEEIAPDNVAVDDDGNVTVSEMPRLSAGNGLSSADQPIEAVIAHENGNSPENAQNGHSDEIWPSNDTIGQLVQRIIAKDGLAPGAPLSDIARWAKVEDVFAVVEWQKYPTRKAAAEKIKEAYEDEHTDPVKGECRSARYENRPIQGGLRGVVILELLNGSTVEIVGRDKLRDVSPEWKEYVSKWVAGDTGKGIDYVFEDATNVPNLFVTYKPNRKQYQQIVSIEAVSVAEPLDSIPF